MITCNNFQCENDNPFLWCNEADKKEIFARHSNQDDKYLLAFAWDCEWCELGFIDLDDWIAFSLLKQSQAQNKLLTRTNVEST